MIKLLTLSVIVVAANCAAQTQGNAPYLEDSYQSATIGSVANQIAYPEPIAVGDELVFCINIDATAPTPTVSDSLGNTWTMTAGTTSPSPQTTNTVYMAYTHSAFSGADTISYLNAGSLGNTASVGRLKNVSGTLDGSLVTATYVGNTGVGGGVGSFNTSGTTAVNNSLGISCAGLSSFGTKSLGPSTSTEMGSFNAEDQNFQSFLAVTKTTTAGTYTPTFGTYNDFSFGSHATFMAQTLFFRPAATIAIGDTALPDAASGVAYSYQLHCIGGTAAQTYSLFSGAFPSGITLNTSTGVISGTTTSTGTSSLQFKCTDGTNTSAAQSLNLTVDAAFGTPSVRQSAAFGLSQGTFTNPVVCGDLIAVYFYGADTHGSSGWVWPSTSGSSVTYHDSLGTVFHRVSPIGGTEQAGYSLYVGQALQTGVDTVKFDNTLAQGGTGLSSVMIDISGAQALVENGTMTNASSQASSPISLNNSFTTVVPNELLLVAGSSGGNSSDTISLSPLSVGVSNNSSAATNISSLGWILLTSPTAYTATGTFTTSVPHNNYGNLIMAAIRPGAPSGSCRNSFGPGEKIRRVAW